jgi:hypothetical protein
MPNNDTASRAVAAVAMSRREVCVAENDAASSADKTASTAVLEQAKAPTSETYKVPDRDMLLVPKANTRKRHRGLLRA